MNTYETKAEAAHDCRDEMAEQELTQVSGGLIGLLRQADGSVAQALAGDGSVRSIIAI